MPNKKQIYIIASVIIFLVVLAYVFYRRGKKQVTLQSAPGELPGNPQSGNVSGASNDEIKRLANNFYEDMNGFNGLGHNYEPYTQALLLNDGDLVKLYNAFNTIYQKDSGQTLTQWILSERYTSPGEPGLLVSRLKKLNSL
jgi:hypothetical protein